MIAPTFCSRYCRGAGSLGLGGGYRTPLLVPTSRPITLGSAPQGDRFREWNQWDDTPREIDLYGGDAGQRRYGSRAGMRPWSHRSRWSPPAGAT